MDTNLNVLRCLKMDFGRRSGMRLSKRRRTRVIASPRKRLPTIDSQPSVRPLSRRVESVVEPKNPRQSVKSKSTLKRPKTKKSAHLKRPQTKSSKQPASSGPSDPMVSVDLSSVDLQELRELERRFLENQSYLRRFFPAPPEPTKVTPPASRRSGVSITVSRSAATKPALVPGSRSGGLGQLSKSGARPTSRSLKNETSATKSKKSKEQVAAEMISDSVRYVAREWIGMNIMRDFIPAKKWKIKP